MNDKNQKFTKQQLNQIRQLEDFDLIMFLSEIHDHGVPAALVTLGMIIEASNNKPKVNGTDKIQ